MVNETYGVADVDAQGRLEWLAAPADAGWPSADERQRMLAMLSPGAASLP